MIRLVTAVFATLVICLASSAEAGFWHRHAYAYPAYPVSAVMAAPMVASGQVVLGAQSIFASPLQTVAYQQPLMFTNATLGAAPISQDQINNLATALSQLNQTRQNALSAPQRGLPAEEVQVDVDDSDDSGVGSGKIGGKVLSVAGRLLRLEKSLNRILAKIDPDCESKIGDPKKKTKKKVVLGSGEPEEVAPPTATDIMESLKLLKKQVGAMDANIQKDLDAMKAESEKMKSLMEQLKAIE